MALEAVCKACGRVRTRAGLVAHPGVQIATADSPESGDGLGPQLVLTLGASSRLRGSTSTWRSKGALSLC